MTLLVPTRLRGAGGNKGASASTGATEAPNTLQAKNIARVLDVIGEGPINGVVDGDEGVHFDNTPLLSADGTTYNFKGAKVTLRVGEPTQDHIPGFDASATTVSVGTEVKHMGDPYANSVVRRITDPDADAARVTISIPALTEQDTKTGDLKGYSVQFAIDVKSSADLGPSVYVEKIFARKDGKTTTAWPVQYRIPLEGSPPWDIRMRRVSVDDSSAAKKSQTFWTSYAILKEHKLMYPNTALALIEVDSSQFGNSIPSRSYEVEGLILQVPSNYNATARTYSGIWSGTFSTAYTNNPAWVLYDLCTNKRYGLGDIFAAANIDKWDLYPIAQYCDAYDARPGGTTDDYHATTGRHGVPDGNGGFQPRFTFNGVLNTPQKAYEALTAIAGMCRTSMLWADGKLRMFQDKPTSSVKVFGPANVIDGKFTYTGTALRARHTSCHVTWNNPAMDYEVDTVVVEDRAMIKRYGDNPLKITAFGCTNYGQAVRHARYALATERLETDSVQFSIGDGEAGLVPGNVIKIADPAMTQAEWAGRAISCTTTVVTLDRPLAFNPARTYTLNILLADGTLASKAFTNPGTTTDTITVTTAFSGGNLPVANAMWAIESDLLPTRTFRVITIAEDGPVQYKIFAVEYAAAKFDEADAAIRVVQPGFSDLQDPSVVLAPGDIQATYLSSRTTVGSEGKLVLSWVASDDQYLRGYLIKYQFGDDNWITLPEQLGTDLVISNPQPRLLRVLVHAVSQRGRLSLPAWYDVDLSTGNGVGLNLVSGLSIPAGGTSWTGRDLHLKWASIPIFGDGSLAVDGSDPYFKRFRIRVKDVSDVVLKTYYSVTPQLVVPYEEMQAFGLARSYKVGVAVEDVNGTFSNELVSTFSNPAPTAPTVTFEITPYALRLKFPQPSDPDYAGILVYMSTTNGFTPGSGNIVWNDSAQPTIPLTPGTTYYVRYLFFDAFGTVGISASSQQTVVATTIGAGSFDTTPPATPTGLAFSSSQTITADGAVALQLTADWNDNSESDLAGYDVVLYADGTFISSERVSASRKVFPVRVGVDYAVTVFAVDRLGNVSTSGVSNSTGPLVGDTTPPGTVTSALLTPLARRIVVSWVNPTDADFSHVQVFRNTTNTTPTGATTPYSARFDGSVFTDTNVVAGTTYHYWVRTFDRSGNGNAAFQYFGSTSPAFVTVAGGDVAPTDPVLVTGYGVAASVSGQGPLVTLTPPSYAGNTAAFTALGAGKTFINTSDSNKLASTFDPGATGPGAVVKLFASSAGGSTATSSTHTPAGDVRLVLTGEMLGGGLDADADWYGRATLKETSGGVTNTLGTWDFVTTSNGLFSGGRYGAVGGQFFITDTGTRTGTVTYSVDVVRLSGSNYTGTGPVISCELAITPIT